jgi:PIN domain
MKNPRAHDPVYKAAKDVFAFKSELNLDRTKPERYRIRRLARRRFTLGYPPRKDKDTSIGDAVNWEWILECAKKSGRSVIIVSRDGDYGLQFTGESYLNEWLRHEFSERVGHKSRITLTESLSSALKQIKVHVTKAEEEAEKDLIQTMWPSIPKTVDISGVIDRIVAAQKRDQEELTKSIQAILLETQQRARVEEIAKALKPPIN